MRSIGLLTIALVAVAIIGCDRNKANDTSRTDSAVGTAGTSDRPQVSRADKSFVHDMAIVNIAEVELGKLAPERSTDNEVKKFAQLIVDDHTKSLNGLKGIAAQHNVEVPTALDGRHARVRDKIAKWHGPEFDRAYMDAAVDGHEQVLDMLEPRVDEARLAEYKAEIADRLAGRKAVERAEVVAIIPEKSDNPLTMSLNEWAAATYPIVRAHLDAARLLKIAVDKRPRATN
jgi:putative membrane protein